MRYDERPVLFDCRGDSLVGIVAVPKGTNSPIGLLVIVGGPQYRAGSHRQFTSLCRHLAEQGIPSMRFDYRGMGDATGDSREFTSINEDIRAAMDTFEANCPGLTKVALWGLCDGASAACLYAPQDSRVVGLALLNPWVRTARGAATTYLKHYYAKRLFQGRFWSKVWRQGLKPGSARDFVRSIALALTRSGRPKQSAGMHESLPTRMADSLRQRAVPLLVVLSGRDYVAREFDEAVRQDPQWLELLAGAKLTSIETADHTFSSSEWRRRVEQATTDWIRS